MWMAPASVFGASAPVYRPLQFPRDYGSHPDWRTEWWYITGHASAGTGDAAREFGFQITFFRSRIDATQSMKSAFAARQLIFAHAAITDLKGGKLHHDQRIARAGMNVASASEQDTDVRIRDWSLLRDKSGVYVAHIEAGEFALDLRFAPTQAVLLQGDAGLSRKGPAADELSNYYSEPQLKTTGQLRLQSRAFEAQGTAWLDHEWSETYMAPNAVGWDWIGMNLSDGSALTAFRLRDREGGAVWAGGSFRSAQGQLRVFGHDEVVFEAGRVWKSPATQARYPVEWRIRTPSGRFAVKALLDDQELDSRGSTGAVYWEGLSDLLDDRGVRVGRGYLELVGYMGALRM
ncbi:carotenoid 1,2-hydratase [Variovorax sp. J22R133]|uniref:lipocalin-like domain-containing protein n=1 Tax=Variovorax brevis TaxID=3053503 RepID=UPI00257814A0|nr:carotenoid 1,2-hydratase [Variovorax sp. J22R133]MDM0113263.1 carotenoid 1,2-hydratase [Variovorax sp. J22R133]